MKGFVELTRDTGKKCWVRVDEIASVMENTTKVDGKEVACITVYMRNNVAWHFLTTWNALKVAMEGAAGGLPLQVTNLAA